jgi:hypothetical protein
MPAVKSTEESLSMSIYNVVDSTSNTLSTSMKGGGGAGVGVDRMGGEGAVALEGGGGARPMRLTAFVFTLLGGAPLGWTAFVFTRPFLSAAPITAGGVTAGRAAAAAGASKCCFGILFLFNEMAAEIMDAMSPVVGGPPTGTLTTAVEGGA